VLVNKIKKMDEIAYFVNRRGDQNQNQLTRKRIFVSTSIEILLCFIRKSSTSLPRIKNIRSSKFLRIILSGETTHQKKERK